MMNLINTCLLDKDAGLWLSSMATKGTRGSTSCGINDSSRNSSKVRRVWINATHISIRYNLSKIYFPTINCILLMGSLNHKNGMCSTNGPEGANCIFFSRTHENSCSCHIYYKSMRDERSTYVNDSPWISFIRSLFTSKNSIRTKKNTDTSNSTRIKDPSAPYNTMVITNVCSKIRPSSFPKINRRNINTILSNILINMVISNSRNSNSFWGNLFANDISAVTTRANRTGNKKH